jgi:hypothetical protein
MAQPFVSAARRERGQVLAFFAIVLPLVVVPAAAYAVDAAVVAQRAAALQAATAQAAEAAAQALSVDALRSHAVLALDPALAERAAAAVLGEEDPDASLQSIQVGGVEVTIVTGQTVSVPFGLWGGGMRLHAHAGARLVAGYDSPSSLLPLPSSTF